MKLFNLFPLRLIKRAIFFSIFDVLSKSTSGPSEKRLTISSALASKKICKSIALGRRSYRFSSGSKALMMLFLASNGFLVIKSIPFGDRYKVFSVLPKGIGTHCITQQKRLRLLSFCFHPRAPPC